MDTTYTISSRNCLKFLMRYQQFASSTYCGAAGPVSKMASQQEKAFCALRFYVSRSVITVQREFRARLKKYEPHKNNITTWYRQSVETGCLCKGRKWRCGRCCVSGCVLNRTRCDWRRPLHQQAKWKGVNFARRCGWKWRKMVSYKDWSSPMKAHCTSVARWTDTMSVSGEPSNHMHRQSTRVTLQKSTFSVRCPERNFTAQFSSLKQLWLATHFWTCRKTGWMPIVTVTVYSWTEFPSIFRRLYKCFSIAFLHSAGSDVLLMETTTFSLPPHSPDLTLCNFFHWGLVKDSVYVPPLSSPSRNFMIG
jgi:hypothetical protein